MGYPRARPSRSPRIPDVAPRPGGVPASSRSGERAESAPPDAGQPRRRGGRAGPYQGQALTARDPGSARCHAPGGRRGNRSSRLVRAAAAGIERPHQSFESAVVCGVLRSSAPWPGRLGDRASLGFIAETEKQVESHLRDHWSACRRTDQRSRAILEQMTHDEMQHGAKAASLGGKDLPFPAERRRCARPPSS